MTCCHAAGRAAGNGVGSRGKRFGRGKEVESLEGEPLEVESLEGEGLEGEGLARRGAEVERNRLTWGTRTLDDVDPFHDPAPFWA
ncbi:hypothetical protein GCM10017600_69810 [Streptosporangium carneum]|uniref:Uncharacterized protein n=1 Tax=Streptosporangium carneum TaxID=47481 RepID=A0A9W6MGX0_9ACTN|nr:hypothetical protein GCM10017600_69810 [Streptosporangium carneum]